MRITSCFLTIFFILGPFVHLHKTVSAQESAKDPEDIQSFEHERLKALEMRLKALETRLQAVEGKAPSKEVHQTFEQRTSPSLAEETPLKNVEQRLEALEMRLQALEETPPTEEGTPSRHGLARYQDGFYLYSDEDGAFKLRLGGTLQVDYRYYEEEERADNRFDIRRARLLLTGCLYDLLDYRIQYEFQGSESKELLDAYGEVGIYGPHVLRIGQFKEPFSLEWQTKLKDLYFAERHMGYYLAPGRDVGLMVQGSFFGDSINYAIGLFNGDGTDGSSRGSESDSPEVAARMVVAPFKTMSWPWLKSFQIGGSATRTDVDLTNVDLDVKSTGMVGTTRNLYVLNSNTKFGVLHDAGQRRRSALEAAWAWGPLAVQGEYVHLRYTDLKPATGPLRDADFFSWYGSALFFLTGEHPEFREGIPQSVKPKKNFNPDEGGWGALGLGLRMERFSGDEDWITDDAYVSVKEADAWSLALNWIMNPAFRLIADYTCTDLSDRIRVRTNSDGTVDYIDKEHVFTLRSELAF